MTYKRIMKAEMEAAIHKHGVWTGRIAFREHEKWGLWDNYLHVHFTKSDFEVIDGKRILDMRINTAANFMMTKEPLGSKRTEVLFFRRLPE